MRNMWGDIVMGIGLTAVGGLLGLACRSAGGRVKGRSAHSCMPGGTPPECAGQLVSPLLASRETQPKADAYPPALPEQPVLPSQNVESKVVAVSLRVDEAGECVRLKVAGHSVLTLPACDREGLKLLSTWLVRDQHLSSAEAAVVQGIQPRCVEGYQAIYAATHNSADLMDRRYFNGGQSAAYRLEPYKAALIRHIVLNALQGRRNTERGLAEQMGCQVDDRTVGWHLHAMGWRAAEAAGLPEEVAAYLDKVRQAAYWAGVTRQPLESVLTNIQPQEWQTPQPGVVGISLGVAHLALTGAYASLKRLVGDSLRMGHTYLVYLLKSGGARVSQAKHFVWEHVGGVLVGYPRASATGLRRWLMWAAKRAQDKVDVVRSDGSVETISRLQDYQEEAVAQRLTAGLISARAIYVDDYVNAVYRREPIAQAKHGTWARVVKAFRRHMAQDMDSGHAVTCPLGRSDVTPLAVLQHVVRIVQGGLDRAGLGHPQDAWGRKLEIVTVDRWWSVKSVIMLALGESGPKVMMWGKDNKSMRDALAKVSEEDLKKHPVFAQVRDQLTGQIEEKMIGYRLDTNLSLDGVEQPIRGVVDWNGQADSPKRVRLAVGITPDEMDTQAVVDGVRFRQRIEILLKLMQRRLNLPAFGGGAAKLQPVTHTPLDEEARHRLIKNRKQVATHLANDQAKLRQVEQEMEHVKTGQAPTNGLKLGRRELKKVAQNLGRAVQRATARLKELDVALASSEPGTPPPPVKPVADLELTRESIVTQLKLDVLTAQENLVDDFIEHGLKPVLREEAEQQATARQQHDLRSTAKGREGQPLCADVEKLYQTKLANLERETILERLLNQPGESVRHKTQPILLVVFQRFHDRRMQAAFERYCVVLNQRDIRIPLEGGQPWRLLFTYHVDTPSSHAQFK